MTSFIDTVFPMATAEKLATAMELPDDVMSTVASWTYAVVGPAADGFEQLVKTALPDLCTTAVKWLEQHEHPFAKRLPFLNPFHVVFAVIMYFAIIAFFTVFGKIVGKHKYNFLGIVHNYFLHALSLYMSVGLAVSARAAGYSLWNNAAGTTKADWRVAKLVWVFYVSKVPEWMDTVLMVLKHNYRQVSFLHVYHHVTIYVIWFIACVMAPGGEAYYSAMVNSAVHVVMYGYYFLTMLFPSGSIRKFLNKFKFIITKGQMTQFFFNCLQSLYDLLIVPRSQLKYSANLLQLLFWYMVTLLALFGNFLAKNSRAHPRRTPGGPDYSDSGSPAGSPVSSPTTRMSPSKTNGATSSPNGKGSKNGKNGQSAGAKPLAEKPTFRDANNKKKK